MLMEFERKDTGGFWRRPFMATMLPLVDRGDVFIMRKVMRGAADYDWKPVFTIWDMKADRKRPLELARFDNPPAQPPGFVSDGSQAGKGKATEAVAAVPAAAESGASSGAATAVTTASIFETTTTPASAGSETGTAGAETATAASAGSSEVQSVTATTAPAVTTSPAVKTPPAAAVDEDPLFGTEFDITF